MKKKTIETILGRIKDLDEEIEDLEKSNRRWMGRVLIAFFVLILIIRIKGVI